MKQAPATATPHRIAIEGRDKSETNVVKNSLFTAKPLSEAH
jgi:hypothetical protein